MFKYLSIFAALVVLTTGTADAQQLDIINTDYLSNGLEAELESVGHMLLWLLIVTAAIPVCLCSIALTLEEESDNEIAITANLRRGRLRVHPLRDNRQSM